MKKHELHNKLNNKLCNSLLVTYCSFLVVLLSLPSLSYAQIRVDRYLETGRNDLSKKNYSKAMQTFSRIIRVAPENFEGWYLRGLTKFYQNDLAGASHDLDEAIKLNPAVVNLFLMRGVIRDMRGDFYGALADFTEGIRIHPNHANLYYSRGSTRLRLGSYTQAIIDFDEALRIDERMVSAYVNRGIAKAQMMDNDGAFSDYNQAILLNPFLPDPHNRKGLLYYHMKEYQEALVSFGEAIQRDSTNPQHFYLRALSWYEMKRTDSCLNDLDRVLQRDPRHSLSYYNRAIIRAKLGDSDGAIEDYLKVNELHPYHILSFFNRGLIRRQTGDQLGALYDMDQAILIYPDFARAYQVRASIKRQLGDDLGAQTDLMLANEKITANLGKDEDDLAMNYADTTIQFADLIRLNSVFENSFNDAQLTGGMAREIVGLSRTRVTKDAAPESNEELFLQIDFGGANFALLENAKKLMTSPNQDVIRNALELAVKHQYNEATALLDPIVAQKDYQALLVRAQIRFDMIEFVKNTLSINQLVPMQLGNTVAQPQKKIHQQVDYNQVIQDYDFLIQYLPDVALVYFNRGVIHIYQRDLTAAIADFNKASELVPDYGAAWLNLGITKIKVNDKDQSGCLALSKAGELGLEEAYLLISKYCGR